MLSMTQPWIESVTCTAARVMGRVGNHPSAMELVQRI